MTQLQQICTIIIKRNPEIVELQFGCKVKLISNPFDEQIPFELARFHKLKSKKQLVTKVSNVSHVRGTTGLWIKTTEISDWIDRAWFKIIGRPIRLGDVLLAIDKNYKGDQAFKYRAFKRDAIELLALYRLGDDNIDNQPEECISFIHKILI